MNTSAKGTAQIANVRVDGDPALKISKRFVTVLCDLYKRLEAAPPDSPEQREITEQLDYIVFGVEPRHKVILSCECGKRYFVAGDLLVPIKEETH